MTSINLGSIEPMSNPSWKPQVNETVKGIVTYASTPIMLDFEGKDEHKKLRVDLETETGDVVTIWGVLDNDPHKLRDERGGYPNSMVRAISAAVAAAGVDSVSTGGILAIKRVGDKAAHKENYNPQKMYQAEYRPPVVPPQQAVQAVEPVQQPQPVQAPQPAPVPQPAQAQQPLQVQQPVPQPQAASPVVQQQIPLAPPEHESGAVTGLI